MRLGTTTQLGYCSLVKATSNVLSKLKIENVTKAKITSAKRLEKNLVDPVAMREAIVNAIVHNDFSREIPPVFELFTDKTRTIFSVATGCCEIMRVFRDIGLVEQLGSGMSRILKVYDKNVFEISDHFVKVVFPFSADNGNVVDNVVETFYLLKERPNLSTKSLAEILSISERQVQRILKQLKDNHKIERVGDTL